MSSVYRKHQRCRICNHRWGGPIDKSLINGITYKEIIRRFAGRFSKEEPLTGDVLKSHKKHLMDGISMEVSRRANLPATVDPANPPHAQKRNNIFEVEVGKKLEELDVMGQLIESGLSDLQNLEPKDEKDRKVEVAGDVLLRNRVRRDTGRLAMESARIKTLAIEDRETQFRMEKQRILMKTLEVVRKVIENLPPIERNPLIQALKAELMSDQEIRMLVLAAENV